MKTARATLHMVLAAYLADDPDRQVLRMAKRYRHRTISKRTKGTMQTIINSPDPVICTCRVWNQQFNK